MARLVTRPHAIGGGAHELGRRAGERADQLALATLAWRLRAAMPAPAIQRVLIRAMSPDPSQRFGSVTALVEALEEAALNAAIPGPTTNAPVVSTLVGATIQRSRRSDRYPRKYIAPPDVLGAARPQPKDAPTPALASPPSSLTQQFFAEGEQLEIAACGRARRPTRGAVAERDEGDLETAAAPRVPRSRAQMTAAALLALGSVALIGWTVMSLAGKPGGRSARGRRPTGYRGRASGRGLTSRNAASRREPPAEVRGDDDPGPSGTRPAAAALRRPRKTVSQSGGAACALGAAPVGGASRVQ